jgi:type II secretory pathway component GspD/PulD (secretin)
MWERRLGVKKVHLVSWLGSVGLAGLLAGDVAAQVAPGSVPPGPPTNPTEQRLKPRSALQQGKDHHGQGEYDIAAVYLEQAGRMLDSLSEAERNELKEYLRLNNEAVNARRQGLQQMQQLSDALQAGKKTEAEQLLRALRSNRYLNAQDRETVAALAGQMKPGAPVAGSGGTTPPVTTPKPAVKQDPDALLTQARQALKNNDFDRAMQLARDCEKAGHKATFPWNDSPAKVMKEAQAAQAKLNKPAPVKPAGKENDNKAVAVNLLRNAKQAVESGDLLRAKQLVAQAEGMNVKFAVFEEINPEKVKSAIARAEMTMAQNDKKPSTPAPQVPKETDPKKLVKMAKQELEKGDLDQAEVLAKQARLTPASWGMFEDKPEKVLNDIASAREQYNQRRAGELLTQARQAFMKGNYDEAEKLANQSEALRKSYPIWHRGERPDKLRDEIHAKRKQTGGKPTLPPLLDAPVKSASKSMSDPSKPTTPGMAVPLPSLTDPRTNDPRVLHAEQRMNQARVHMKRGEMKEAVDLAIEVKKMNVGKLPSGDNPDNILQAVAALQKVREERREPQLAQQADTTRAQALQLLAQARLQMRDGRILDARQSVEQAKRLGATYQASDDLPETVMVGLQQAAIEQIQKYSDAAATLEQRGDFKQTLNYLGYVQQVSTVYNVPAPQVAERMAAVKTKMTTAAAQPPAAPMPPVAQATPVGTEGQKLLSQAQQALRDGQTAQARKLGDALYTGPYNMKPQAGQLLAQVDAAEFNLKVKRAQMGYDQLVKAYQRKEYDVARTYADSFDSALLDERRRAHVQEMMSGPEMQPKRMVQTAVAKGEKADGNVVVASGQQPAKDGILDEARQRQAIEQQRLTDLRKNALKKSNELANKGEHEAAIKTLEDAITAIKASEIDVDRRNQLLPTLENRHKQFAMMRTQMNAVKSQNQRLQERQDSVNRKAEYEQQKRDMVAQHMRKHKQYLQEGKFAEAEREAMMAKELDPDNPALVLAVETTTMKERWSNEEKIRAVKEAGTRDMASDASDTGVVVSSIKRPVSYDKETFGRASRRRSDGTPLDMKPKTDKEKESLYKLSSSVKVDFRDKPLREAIDELRLMKGIDIFIDEASIKAESVNLDQPVTLQLTNHSLQTALRLLLHNARLTYVVKEGYVMVTTPNGAKPQKIQRIYPVHDLIVPRDDTANMNDAVGTSFDQRSNGSGLSWQRLDKDKNREEQSQHSPMGSSPWDDKKTESTRKPYQTLHNQLQDLIVQTIDPMSWDEKGGGGTIKYYPLGMSLVISQTPDVQEQVEDLLARLRELQALQVTVETRIVTLSEDFYERIGIDFDININDKQTNFDRQIASGNFAPPGQLNDPDHLHNVVVGLTPVNSFTQSLDIPINQSSFAASALPGGFASFPGTAGANGGLDVGVAFLSSIECYLFLEAVQGDVRSNIMTAPKITLFNGQTASISNTVTRPFVASFTAVRDLFTGDVVLVPNVQTVTEGLTLTVQAVVTADRRYVQLTLAPTIQQILRIEVFEFGNGNRLQQPVVANLSVATAVLVPDGGTILLGGIKNMEEQRREFGVPLLSKLPYINRLFRNQSFGREATSTLFLVTPRIIIPEEEEERLGNLGTFTF